MYQTIRHEKHFLYLLFILHSFILIFIRKRQLYRCGKKVDLSDHLNVIFDPKKTSIFMTTTHTFDNPYEENLSEITVCPFVTSTVTINQSHICPMLPAGLDQSRLYSAWSD